MRHGQETVDYTVHDGVISSDPDLMAKMIDPAKLVHGENFFVTDALNTLGETMWLGDEKEGKRGAEDGKTYDIATVQVKSALTPYSLVRPVNVVSIPGWRDEGAAFAIVMKDEVQQPLSLERPLGYNSGAYLRPHSACAFSEVGRQMTRQIYEDPRWIYDHREVLRPLFMPYKDGMAVGYPTHGNIRPEDSCDCRQQRQLSQEIIALLGGYYVSLAGDKQEGRGYGWKEKLAAYEEEERLKALGLPSNTKIAFDNRGLYPYDKRKYGHLARFLGAVGTRRVRLLSNNKSKEADLEGIDVIRVSLVADVNELSEKAERYVETKRVEFGHDVEHRFNLALYTGSSSVEFLQNRFK